MSALTLQSTGRRSLLRSESTVDQGCTNHVAVLGSGSLGTRAKKDRETTAMATVPVLEEDSRNQMATNSG